MDKRKMEMRQLKCNLTDEEVDAKGRELARSSQDEIACERHEEAEKARHKIDLGELKKATTEARGRRVAVSREGLTPHDRQMGHRRRAGGGIRAATPTLVEAAQGRTAGEAGIGRERRGVIVVGVDPGPESGAVVLFDSEKRDVLKVVELLNDDLLREVSSHARYCSAFAIEKVESFGMAVGAEVFETVFWTGRLVQAWLACGRTTPYRIGRKEIKIHLCGSMKAKDANIRRALIDKLGPQGTKKSPGPTYGVSGHMWAALAVAVTCAETRLKEGA